MELFIASGGLISHLYDEAVDLRRLGDMVITRASHVEPDAAGHWWADLSPVGGPMLGPFELRSTALLGEVAWLTAHRLGSAKAVGE